MFQKNTFESHVSKELVFEVMFVYVMERPRGKKITVWLILVSRYEST